MMQPSDVIFVPFRCPDCKDSYSFETLKELRTHLQEKHGDIYAQSARKHFGSHQLGNRRRSPILELFRADTIQIEEALKGFKESELNNKKHREEMSYPPPSREPHPSMEYSSRGRLRSRGEDKSTFRSYGHPSRVKYKYFRKQDMNTRHHGYSHSSSSHLDFVDDDFLDDSDPQRHVNGRTSHGGVGGRTRSMSIERIQNLQAPVAPWTATQDTSDVSFRRKMKTLGNELDSHIQETLSSLSQEVVVGRSNQQATLDSLRSSQQIFSQLEQSAEDRISRQQDIIATLTAKLSEREDEMANILIELNTMKKQHVEEMEVKHVLNQKSTLDREILLQEEISNKQNELESLSDRLKIAREAVMQYRGEIKEKKENTFKPNNDDSILPNTMDNNNFLTKANSDTTKRSTDGYYVSGNADYTNLTPDIETNDDLVKMNSAPTSTPKSKEMSSKDIELARLKSKSKQLENDRQTLLLEMQTLLETAATDNEKLRTELTNQGKQLSKLNLELERSKQEQSELLGETNTLYFQADLSLTRLKQMLEDKDGQLSTVTGQLEQAKEMQNKLIKEREEYLRLAEERESNYRSLVQENALQLQTMKDSLNDSQLEKAKLETKMMGLKKELEKKEQHDGQMEDRLKQMENQLSSHEDWQDKMLEQINNKEERLLKAKNSMEKMNSFLSDAADRELETRSKLEQFIATLVERSTQAETELQRMKIAYAAKVKALTDTMRFANESLPFDWAKQPTNAAVSDRRVPDQVSQSDDYEEDDAVVRYRRPSATQERNYQSTQPKQLASRTERLRGKSSYSNSIENHEQRSPERTRPQSRGTPNREYSHPNMKQETSRDRRLAPRRRMKSRPLLIQGKEFPHSGSSTSKHATSKMLTNKDKRQMSKSMDNLHSYPSFPRTLSDLSLPVMDKDEPELYMSFPQRKSSISEAARLNASFEKKNPSHGKQRSPVRPGKNDGLFKNTPEVNRMYRNVQNSMNSQKENFKRTPSTGKRRLSNEFLIDDDGIIWGSFDLSDILNQTWPEENQKSSYNHNTEQQSHEESEDDKGSPLRMKKHRQNKLRSKSHMDSPVPLGDKIAKVLISMENSPLQSSARRDYSENMKKRSPSMNSLINHDEKPIQQTTSDSLQSSPVHRAQEIQKRVEKLTSTSSIRTHSPLPARRSKTLVNKNHALVNDLSDDYNTPKSKIQSVPRMASHDSNDAAVDSDFSFTSYASLTLEDSQRKNKGRNNSVSWFDDENQTKNNENESDNLSRSYSVPERNPVSPTMTENQVEESTYSYVASDSHNEVKDVPAHSSQLTKSDSEEKRSQTIRSISRENSVDHVDSQISYNASPRQFSSEEEKSWCSQDRMSDEEDITPASSVRQQNSLERQSSLPEPKSFKRYDLVMKELKQKHPYLPEPELEQEQEERVEAGVAHRIMSIPSESFEENKDYPSCEDHPEESTDNGVLSSDDETTAHHIQDENVNGQKTYVIESVDASTDTDLEKLSRPGYSMRKVNATRRKRKPTGKRQNARARQSAGHSDVANWTSTDTNDMDETDQEDRWTKRRRRVALFCVLQYVDTETLLVVSQVCRKWKKISHHPALWKKVVLKNRRISSQFLVTVSQWCSQTESLSLTGLTGRPQRLMESEENYQSETRGSLESGLERLLFTCQGSLQSLSIEQCENILTDKCLWLISGNCRMLTSLCYRSTDHPATPQLLWALGGGCPGITTLQVHPVPGGIHSGAMNNRFLLLIGQFYRDLQEIGLGGKEFDMAGLIPMVQSCQRLKVIHLDCCMTLTDDLTTAMCRAGLKDLEILITTGTGIHAKALQTLQKNCRHLRKISLSVNAQDFGHDPSKRKDRDAYKKSVQALTDLQKKAGFSNILTVEADKV